MPETVRILIAEDHAVVRDGLAAVLKFERDMTVVGLAQNGLEAVKQFRELKPDVVLMDLAMPGAGWRRSHPGDPRGVSRRPDFGADHLR
jgi:DNA-binding NarL/FixJ family response regulator